MLLRYYPVLTLGQTRTQETRDLLDESLRSDEGIVLASKLLDELLVLVELLQVVGRHGIDTAVFGTVEIVLVTQDADAHVGAGNGGQLDGAGETLVTLRVIVLEADLELDGLEKVSLLGGLRVLEQFADVVTHSGCGGVRDVSMIILLLSMLCKNQLHDIPTVILDMMTVFQ